MATATKPRTKRKVTEAQKARSAESKAAANEALAAYAVLCLSEPAELEAFRVQAASVGWKEDPASDEPGYSVLNMALLAAQRRRLVHCGGFHYWLEQGRCVAKGATSLGTFRRIGRNKTDEQKAEEKQLAEEGWQSAEKRKPRYYVKKGTFDVSQTIPRERCPHCGTAPDGPDDLTTQCPPTCAVFATRPGVKPPLDLVVALMTSLLPEDDEEAEGDE